MDSAKRSAHIAAYFLSRFDKEALAALGYKNDRQAFHGIGEKLGILPNYIKFRRDEFDVTHPHRKGWHKRPMSPSVSSIISTFKDMEMAAVESIVKDLLSLSSSGEYREDLQRVIHAIDENAAEKNIVYSPRGITGRKAEEVFMHWFNAHGDALGQNGKLKDRRDHGCGYDFLIDVPGSTAIAVEVKGLSGENSGILFTDKEWETSKNMGEDYYLALIRSMEDEPSVELICDPYRVFAPKRNMQTVIQVSWTLSAAQLRNNKINK